jgi:hypothetical protein
VVSRKYRARLALRRMRWTLKQRGQAVYYSTTPRRDVPGIDLRDRQQLELIESFAALPKFPFASATTAHRYRYSTDNDWFGPDDAVMLYCVLSQFRPAHVVEVGSGFSSALISMSTSIFLVPRRSSPSSTRTPSASSLFSMTPTSDEAGSFGNPSSRLIARSSTISNLATCSSSTHRTMPAPGVT